MIFTVPEQNDNNEWIIKILEKGNVIKTRLFPNYEECERYYNIALKYDVQESD